MGNKNDGIKRSSTYIIFCLACGATKRILANELGLNLKQLLCIDCYVNYQKEGVIRLKSGDKK